MRLLVDTSVVISAALRNRTPEAVILFIVSPELLRRWFDLLDACTILMDVDVSLDFPRDQQDAKFLACALAADADFLITGDRDFTEAVKLLDTTILSPAMFKRLVIDTWVD